VKTNILSRAAHVSRWLIPLAILLLIFWSIDWHKFVLVLAQTNSWLILLGILYYPLVILLGAVRWHMMLKAFHSEQVHYANSLKDYWSGLAVGVFAPASIGWDVFRVAVSTKRYGNVVANSATIVVEKLMALLTCASLVTFLVPFMTIAADNEDLRKIIETTHLVLLGTIGVLAVGFLLAKNDSTIRFLYSFSNRFELWLRQLAQSKDLSNSQTDSLSVTFAPLRRPSILGRVTVVSFLIQLASAIGNHIFFIAVDHDLPILVNLFVGPVLFFVFLLPISLGSLGIREGAYILLYGAFNVPMETALLVSFVNLLGILLNNLIGGILLALNPNLSSHTRPIQ